MNTVYFPVKHKTNIIGLWQDNKKRIYKDCIIKKEYNTFGELSYYINQLFRLKEKAVFYTAMEKAYIQDNKGNKDVLNHCIKWEEKNLKCSYIKELLKRHNGLTIYRKFKNNPLDILKGKKAIKYYVIELWK